ncbi:hypothetical protein BS47DRAFT_1359649 [Hydnum rufescens UP504]|uniref:Uncharacterized protein n=1 Tax=Hydnum rufescens UP504 TaxID=1448309 RepID=A0A9P6DZU1_9AGAM|nr:hypothetical protein BS47DRAFT_1359649 [Hydnum rufescens UP504]
MRRARRLGRLAILKALSAGWGYFRICGLCRSHRRHRARRVAVWEWGVVHDGAGEVTVRTRGRIAVQCNRGQEFAMAKIGMDGEAPYSGDRDYVMYWLPFCVNEIEELVSSTQESAEFLTLREDAQPEIARRGHLAGTFHLWDVKVSLQETNGHLYPE